MRILAIVTLLVATAAVRADVGPPPPPSPDFRNSPPLATAAAGLGLSALAIFGGLWAIRNPRAAFGLALVVLGGVLAVPGVFVVRDGEVSGLICLLPGLLSLVLGVWLLLRKAPFVGRNLAYLIAAVAGLGVLIGGVTTMHWEWTVRPRPQFRPVNENKTPAATPTTKATQPE